MRLPRDAFQTRVSERFDFDAILKSEGLLGRAERWVGADSAGPMAANNAVAATTRAMLRAGSGDLRRGVCTGGSPFSRFWAVGSKGSARPYRCRCWGSRNLAQEAERSLRNVRQEPLRASSSSDCEHPRGCSSCRVPFVERTAGKGRGPLFPARLSYGPCRDRTYDLGIKSPLLYQLS